MEMPSHVTPIDQVKPYWKRWPQILSYPLGGGALSTIAALAIAHCVTNYVPVLGGVLDLLVWTAFFKYGFEVLRWSANGREIAPEISLTVSDSIAWQAIGLLFVIIAALLLVQYFFGFAALSIAGLVLICALPAMLMMLALDENLLGALNPIAWVQLGMRLRGTYFVLVGFFLLAWIAMRVIAALLATALPAFFAVPLTYAAVNYLLLLNFHLIGYVIHQHSDDLGYAGHAALQDVTARDASTGSVIIAARARAAQGDALGASTLLRDEIKSHPQVTALHLEYRHWLRQCGDMVALADHGAVFIHTLLEQGQIPRAIDIARESLQLDPKFVLTDASDVTELAGAAAEAGQAQLALGLLSGFHKRFREHADIARNYLLAARLLAERMNKEMQARALLQQIKVTLPDDPSIPEVDAYLAFLDRVAETPAPLAPQPPAA